MATLPIIKYPNKSLRRKSEKVKDVLDPEIQKLVKDMIATMKKNNGLGLAAPQVKKSLRLCVIEESGTVYVFVNPKITSTSRKRVIAEEGCLSFPGKFIPIRRPEKIKVRYLDEKGIKSKLKAEGILARAIQHEIDHLDGILMIDRIRD
ncbi:peptide deformylase [bacterium BMS3Abin15]|nr:peptide deformylase [bacterium BMS3Abin15]HDH07668.1 peptide deformylase [Candidatus Moranbacteria bacterium]HDZ85681.1 peptide deformylase [Candidatus Moranbacteria bacterium]